MRDKLYFITDAHLGSGLDTQERERDLCMLLDQIKQDAHTVVFLGDMFDFWFSYKHLVPKGHVRLLGKMAELSDTGIALHYFVGNHDMWMFDYLTEQMNIVMHSEPATLIFDNKTFLVGHGDGVGKTDKKFNLLKSIFRNRFNQILFAALPSRLTFGIAHAWSEHSKTKHDNPTYLGDDKEDIVIYCKQQIAQRPIDYCVFGHRHNAIAKPLTEKSEYINVGDWLQHREYAVYSNGKMTLATFNPEHKIPV